MNRDFMYRWSRLLLLLLVLMVVLGVTGCGETKIGLETRIHIDQHKAGTREMVLSMDADNIPSVLGFSTDNLEKILKKSCPKELSWSSKIEDNTYYCTFTLSFDSLKDYRAKVKKITGKKATVNLVASGKVFATGLDYKESFHSVDLLQWLIKALKKADYIESDRESIFEIGSTEILYKDKSYLVAGDQAKVETLVQFGAKRIDICTVYHENNLCDRDVLVFFDEEAISSMGQLIKEKMSNRCPEEATVTWDMTNGDSYCCFHQSNMDAEQLNTFMKTILKGSESFVHGEGIRRPSTFSALRDWNETLDVSMMVLEEHKGFTLGYHIKCDKGVDITVHNQNEGDAITLTDSELYPKYQTVYEKNILGRSIKTQFHVTYDVKTVQVKDRFSAKNKLNREIRFVLDTKLEDEDIGAIVDTIKDHAKEQAEVTLSESAEGTPVICIRTNQSIHVVNQAFEHIFGVEGQTAHEVEKKLMELRHPGQMSTVLDFTKFLGEDQKKVTLEYEVVLPRLETIHENKLTSSITSKNGKESVDKNKYHATTKGAYLELKLETDSLNGDGFYLILMVLCVVLLIAVIRLLPPVVGKVWGQLKKGPQQLNQAFEGYSEEDQAILEQRFENEMRRTSRDKLLREQWRDLEQITDPEELAQISDSLELSEASDTQEDTYVPDVEKDNEIILQEKEIKTE